MSNPATPPAARSGKGPEDMADVTSGYNSGGEEDKPGVGAARERRKKEEAAREKLKEELLRQFEAGQLKADKDALSQVSPSAGEIQKLLRDYKLDGVRETQPRQIPTIEEQRDKTFSTRRSSIPPPRQAVSVPTVPMPDLSRPPPGYLRPAVQAVPVSFYQPQPLYSYEDTIVTRVLQSLMGGRGPQQQVELPSGQSQDVLEKVLSWDMGAGGRNLDDTRRRSVGEMGRSLSKERRHTRSRERSRERSRPKRRRSLSIETICRPAVGRSSSRRKRSRSRSRHEEKKRRVASNRSERARSVERVLRKSNQNHSSSSRREVSPLTRTCSLRTEKSTSDGKRKYESHSVGNSPRIRKIVLLSPMRAKKSVREVIMDERDHTRLRNESHERVRSPVKKRVKDRLGVRKEEPKIMEVYNMDTSLGRCGAVAIVKEFIDSKTGIMELRTSEGGRGAVILFSGDQVWIPDRKRDSNGPPKSYVESSHGSLQTLFPVGQEVLMNARRVESPLVDLQATVIWPKFTEIPDYKIRPKRLDEELDTFQGVCKIEKLVPICINGLAPVGSLNIWSARVRQIVDKDWGVVEIKSVPRDGKREFSFRFFCFFHKSDVWLEEGICVGEHKFFKDKPLGEIVELLQPVDVVARSIIREKGQAMKKAVGSTVEMQALCVSLKPACIPDGAPRGTRVDGGPGAFGGSNRGETPYMFKKGLEHSLNVKLAGYLKASGKVCHNLDPSLVVKPEESKSSKKEPDAEKKVHKLTKAVKPMETNLLKSDVGTVTVDSQNNVVEAIHARPVVKLYEKLSNSTARVKEYLSDSVGLLEENLTKDWVCLFQISDCVLTQGSKPLELYPVGTKVQTNANLVNSGQQIQYIASSVWKKSENAMILPNNVEKAMIPASKKTLFDEQNLKLSHLDLKSGLVVKILDDNFGVINQDSKMILFDTCDFWISQEATAAQSSKSLPSFVSVGDTVLLHAALVQSSSLIPYLATAVWLANHSPFPQDKCPVAIRREKIHPDKIKIYEMVSRCTALQEVLPEVEASKFKNTEGTGTCKAKVYDQKGLVKFAFKLKGSDGLTAAIAEFTRSSKDEKHFAFYLASSSVESHEKTKICIPETKVYFTAVPVLGGEFPVSHIATAVSHIHRTMPLSDDIDKIVETTRLTLTKIIEQKVPESANLRSAKAQIFSLDISNKSKAQDPNVIDCFPTGRLVCMFDEKAGIMEDHRRELAYFEKTDLNLPEELEMKDIVMVMTRCRDVTIRFQATHALDGPVKMIVHDGTVAISSNLERYFPEVQAKKTKISMKPNSFHPEKLSRAKAAVELYKVDKILTPDYIIDSGEFKSTLVKPKRYSSSSSTSISSAIKPLKPAVVISNAEDVKCLVMQTGKVMTILNDSFGLLKFCLADSSSSYCLFDTFDLYLEGDRTAAQSKLTVANVLDLDMEVSFHACEISPGSSVPWLATGVWRPQKANQPKTVAYNKITKEKIAVFKKVAETCSVLVSGGLTATTSWSDKLGEDSCQESATRGKLREVENPEVTLVCVDSSSSIIELNAGKEVTTIKDLVKRKEGLETEELPVLANGSKIVDLYEDLEAKSLQEESKSVDDRKVVGADFSTVEKSVTIGEIPCGEMKLKSLENESGKQVCVKTEIEGGFIDEGVCGDILVKEEVFENFVNEVGESVKGGASNYDYLDCGQNKFAAMEDLKSHQVPRSPLLSLPEVLSDQVAFGTVDSQFSDQFAIVSLGWPAGTRALLHCDRMWVADHVMTAGSGWEELTGREVRVNARRVVGGFEEFDYQVTFAHLDTAFKVEMDEFSYTTDLAEFAENKLEVELLDKELELAKRK